MLTATPLIRTEPTGGHLSANHNTVYIGINPQNPSDSKPMIITIGSAAIRGCSFFILLILSGVASAHGVTEGDQGYIQEISGTNIIPFMYLGAKHMVTGYDHLLFLIGVIFFLYRLADIGIYVTLFAIGHSSTLILGVYFDIAANAYLIDAIIGLSVAYKALDNMGAYQRWFGGQPNTKIAVLVFGLFHGFGLATKMQEFEISREGLLANLLAFNVGVEIGQLLALSGILIVMSYWRRTASFYSQAYNANTLLLTAGFMLIGYQLVGYSIT